MCSQGEPHWGLGLVQRFSKSYSEEVRMYVAQAEVSTSAGGKPIPTGVSTKTNLSKKSGKEEGVA